MASARLMPIALTLIRTSFGPGAGTWTSTNSRTSGPPAFANLIVRGMAVSIKSDRGRGIQRRCRMFFGSSRLRGGRFQGRKIGVAMIVASPEGVGRRKGERQLNTGGCAWDNLRKLK